MTHARTWRLIGGVLLACVASLEAGCGAQPGQLAAGSATSRPVTASRGPSATGSQAPAVQPTQPTPTWPQVLPVPAVPAGLHQTRMLPPARSAVFDAQMTDLWAAIVSGRPDLGLPAFFPLTAYEQVKAIADPGADWRNRLFADFRLDVGAAHDLLGRGARQSILAEVIVPESQAAWIAPGVCYNRVGYWHVAGARVAYKVGGQVMSLGVASLISWRGHWYVVHFGAVLRSTSGGVVDQPSRGVGIPGPPGGC